MTIDTHSVVYFINEHYGVVIRANGANKEIAMWDQKRNGFTKRLNLLMASFLARVDKVGNKWCAAHPTYRLSTAKAAAALLTPNLPSVDGMRLATVAKRAAMRAELHEKGSAAIIREIAEIWHQRETQYAEM